MTDPLSKEPLTVQERVDRFDEALQSGELPRIDDWLPSSSRDRLPVLLALAIRKLTFLHQAGEATCAGDFFSRFPELLADTPSAIQLVLTELRLEQARNPRITEENIRERYPDLALRPEWAGHHLMTLQQQSTRSFRYPMGLEVPNPTDAPTQTLAYEQSRDVLQIAATPPGYEIERELGRGGMGVVYLARQTKLNRPVALKMILGGAHAGTAEYRRFQAEAEAIARFQHPNILQIYESGEHDGVPYLSLEFCAGGGLDKKLAGTPLLPDAAAELTATLARAVHHAHTQGVLHRDLKPGNVLLTAEGRPKVMDFGLAKRLNDESGMTRTGVVMGTPSYMPPEQATGRVREIGPASDVYGIGAMLYEFLTGRPPFKAANALETVHQVIEEDPVPPRRLQPMTPRDLETICLKCLEKEPRKRYASAAELADDLARYRQGEPILARSIGRVERVVRWCRRHPVAAGTILTSVALSLVFVIGVLSVARTRQDHLRELALRKNASDARHVASTVLLRLQTVGSFVERAAADDALKALIAANDEAGLRAYCQELLKRHDVAKALRGGKDPVASWMVLDAKGAILAVSHDEGVKNPLVAGRDYYSGAVEAFRKAGWPVVHLSRGYRSINQKLDKFALASVITEAESDDRIAGVVVLTLATGSSLGPQLLDGNQAVALALPKDTTPAVGPPPEQRPAAEYVLVVHPAYDPQEEPLLLPPGLIPDFQPDFAHELDPPREDVRLSPTDDYRDPVAAIDPRYAGR